jgi:hypothetical protein
MKQTTNAAPPARAAEPRRLSRLFKVLVVGGAVVAATYATSLQGETGTADADGGQDGGTQGW